jgi:ribose/xylose/arabinose/galactoside ABC-type transport system permease subunit
METFSWGWAIRRWGSRTTAIRGGAGWTRRTVKGYAPILIMSAAPSAPPLRSTRRFPEAGLLGVVLVLGILLTWFGGQVDRPRFTVAADGTRERLMTRSASGEDVPATERVNKFLNLQNLAQLTKDTSFVAIMAVGMTFVVIAGQIDLSVGSIYALASVLAALVLHRFGPEGSGGAQVAWGTWLGVFTCLGVGVAAGGLNGAMVTLLRVHPFIITLGTMAVFRGVAFVVTQGQSIGAFPDSLRQFIGWQTEGGLSLIPLLVMLAVGVVGGVQLSRRSAGRHVYAVGGNELAARYSGIRVTRVKLGVFLISGLTAGVAALLSLGYYGSASSGDGQGYELNVIAAAVVGGASLQGGRGSALGALLGALIIQMIDSGIVILGIDQNYSRIIIGTVVIIAVLLDQVSSWWARIRLARA